MARSTLTLLSGAAQPSYLDLHLVARDPYSSLDVHGVGGMIQMAVRRAKRANHRIKVSHTHSCVQFFN
jgi:hypothetical protein